MFEYGEAAFRSLRVLVGFSSDNKLIKGLVMLIDAYSLGNPGPMGFLGVIHGELKGWILGFAGSVGISNIIFLELETSCQVLVQVRDRGLEHVFMESDSRRLEGSTQRCPLNSNLVFLGIFITFASGIDGSLGSCVAMVWLGKDHK
ncbi:hypothetical protein Ancab_023210 [Ancistrocladus abbreviatus]